MTSVPFNGQAPATDALLGGHIKSVFSPYSGLVGQIRAGSLRALAVSAGARIEAMPDVPTLREAGYDLILADGWTGLVAPARTPPARISELSNWFSGAMKATELKQRLDAISQTPVGSCGEAFASLLRAQYKEYGRVIRETNIKAD